MSKENVEAVRAISDAFDRRNEQAFLGHFDMEAELLDRLSLNSHVYRGHDAIGAWFRGWDNVWDEIRGSFVEVIHESGDLVLWRSSARARGKTSGADVSQDFWHFARFRDGRVIRIEHHRSEADALEAAGLSERTMSRETVEVVRRNYEHVTATLQMPPELFQPDFEVDATSVGAGAGVTRGLEAAQAFLRDYWQTFEDFSVELEEVIDASDEQVVTVVRDGGRLKGGDAEAWNRFFHVWGFDHGKIARLSIHIDRNQALKAAGLSE